MSNNFELKIWVIAFEVMMHIKNILLCNSQKDLKIAYYDHTHLTLKFKFRPQFLQCYQVDDGKEFCTYEIIFSISMCNALAKLFLKIAKTKCFWLTTH